MADLGTATIQCTLGAGYIDTSEAERLEGEIAGKNAEIAALEAKIVELNGKIETSKADVLADFKSVIDGTAVNPELPEGLTTIRMYKFYYAENLAMTKLPGTISVIEQHAFDGCRKLALTELPAALTRLGEGCFEYCFNNDNCAKELEMPAGLKRIDDSAFFMGMKLQRITFKGTPDSVSSLAFRNAGITAINVPWAEGEVSGAPWGATKATINYNYTGGEA